MIKRNYTKGFHVWLFGDRFWHRTYEGALRRVERQTYCDMPQIIDVKTGELVYGKPQ